MGKLTVIETRGEGGYCIAPGSPAECHETGNLYEHISAPFVPPAITKAERDCLIRCARVFDEAPPKEPKEPKAPPPSSTSTTDGVRPGDDFDLRGWNW